MLFQFVSLPFAMKVVEWKNSSTARLPRTLWSGLFMLPFVCTCVQFLCSLQSGTKFGICLKAPKKKSRRSTGGFRKLSDFGISSSRLTGSVGCLVHVRRTHWCLLYLCFWLHFTFVTELYKAKRIPPEVVEHGQFFGVIKLELYEQNLKGVCCLHFIRGHFLLILRVVSPVRPT